MYERLTRDEDRDVGEIAASYLRNLLRKVPERFSDTVAMYNILVSDQGVPIRTNAMACLYELAAEVSDRVNAIAALHETLMQGTDREVRNNAASLCKIPLVAPERFNVLKIKYESLVHNTDSHAFKLRASYLS